MSNVFITLAHEHDLLEEVKTVLTRELYDVSDNAIVHFLAKDICANCLNLKLTKLPEAIFEDMLEKRQAEDYIRLSDMGIRVAEFLNCAAERCWSPGS